MVGSGYRPKRRGELGFPFDDLYINSDFRFKEGIPTTLYLRDFLDTAYRNLYVGGLTTSSFGKIGTYLKLAGLYQLKDIGGDLSLRNTADNSYLNLAVNSISLGAETGLSYSGTGVRPGADGARSCRLPLFTTAERDGVLTPIVGDMIYNTDVHKGQIYEGLVPGWVNLV